MSNYYLPVLEATRPQFQLKEYEPSFNGVEVKAPEWGKTI